jgi:MFS family permease
VATRLVRTVGRTAVLRGGLVIEMVTHLILATTTAVWVVVVVLVVFSAHGMVWGVTVASLRQRLVPSRLLGRVGSAYAVLDLGGAAVGSLLGGLIAGIWGVTAPFWVAGVTMAVVALAAWRPLKQSPNRSETIEES